MKSLDLIYVSYNSEKWIDNCFKSLFESDYDLKLINVYVVDNHSSDKSVEKLKNVQKNAENFVHSFQIIETNKNLGFGKANNFGFSKGSSEYVCFFNIDTELFPHTLERLTEEIQTLRLQCGNSDSSPMNIRNCMIR